MSRVFVTISASVVFRELVKLGRNVSTRSKTYWESVSTSVLPSKGSARVGTSPSPSILGTSSNAALPSRIERKCFATVRHSGAPWPSSVKTSAQSKCGRTRWEIIMQQGGAASLCSLTTVHSQWKNRAVEMGFKTGKRPHPTLRPPPSPESFSLRGLGVTYWRRGSEPGHAPPRRPMRPPTQVKGTDRLL